MTIPNERAQVLLSAGEVLHEIAVRPDVPADLRRRAKVVLRHYPKPSDLEQTIKDVDHEQREALDQHRLVPEDEAIVQATKKVLDADVKKSMTDEIESQIHVADLESSDWHTLNPVGREFGSPDYERLEELDILVCRVLGVELCREWLNTPNPALCGKTPEETAASPGGMERIRQVLKGHLR